MEVVGTVSQLYRYPVKSMQGEGIERAEIETAGMVGDRILGVFEVGTTKVLSAKRTAALLDATSALDETSGVVTITLPDGSQHDAADPATNAALSAWLGVAVEVRAADAEAGAPYEIPLEATDADGDTWEFATPAGSLVDLAAAHVLTSASLQAARALEPEADWSIHRFRPTALVTTDGPGGFVEDGWVGSKVALGGATLDVFMACPRCSMPPRAQSHWDLPRDNRISHALRDHHENNLGIYCAVAAPGTITVGDPVSVLT